jgi:TrpR family trp operon transcriptional repressor
MSNPSDKSGWQGFLHLCTKIKDIEHFNEFFGLFMTPEERDDFAKRYLIVKELLLEEKTQREIAKDSGVSIAKITRGSNSLKTSSGSLQKFIKKNLI